MSRGRSRVVWVDKKASGRALVYTPGAMGHLRRRRGQGMVEYSLIISLIVVVVILAVILMGNQLKNTYQNISCNVATHQNCP